MQATWLLLQTCAHCVHAMPANTFKIRYLELNQSEGICLILILGKGRGLAVVLLKHGLHKPLSSPSDLAEESLNAPVKEERAANFRFMDTSRLHPQIEKKKNIEVF